SPYTTLFRSPPRLVQKQDLRFIDDRPRDSDPLLLPSAQRIRHTVFISVQVHQLQRVLDLVMDILSALVLDFQAERNILRDSHMGKKGVFLENGIQLPLIRRKIGDILPIEDHLSRIRRFKSAENTQCGGFSAAARSQKGEKLIFSYV